MPELRGRMSGGRNKLVHLPKPGNSNSCEMESGERRKVNAQFACIGAQLAMLAALAVAVVQQTSRIAHLEQLQAEPAPRLPRSHSGAVTAADVYASPMASEPAASTHYDVPNVASLYHFLGAHSRMHSPRCIRSHFRLRHRLRDIPRCVVPKSPGADPVRQRHVAPRGQGALIL